MAIRQMERGVVGEALRELPELPEMQEIHRPEHVGALSGAVLQDWRPEDKEFWENRARHRPAQPVDFDPGAAAVVRGLAGVVGRRRQAAVGRLQLHARTSCSGSRRLPGISGATLRIFYSFMVPIFGGRLWTTVATWSLMIPAVGIGYAVQNPIRLTRVPGPGAAVRPRRRQFRLLDGEHLVLLPEVGEGQRARAQRRSRQSRRQRRAVPGADRDHGRRVRLARRRAGHGPAGAQQAPLWLQNAGFIWVPFIAASAFASWFGMNDIASAKASFSEQAVIFQRKHNWMMCWLYTGTFGSFIGYSAGFPLLAKTQFPAVDALPFVFLGPLVGALSRSATGWVSDKYGGGRVTFWVFVLMMIGVAGVLYFLGIKDQPGAFWGFFAMFLVLFFATGVGNASTFQMIPNIMRKEMDRLMPALRCDRTHAPGRKGIRGDTGFTSAIAAFGAFFIPKATARRSQLTGGVEGALWAFLIFYVSCLADHLGLLHAARRHALRHRARPPAAPMPPPAVAAQPA